MDRIFDAIAHRELSAGRCGIVDKAARPALDDPDLTVRHVDLKAWMVRYYPGERPSFLFDEIERSIHPAITMEAITVLMADREAARLRVAELVQLNEDLFARHEALAIDHAKQAAESKKEQVPRQRSESTYLNIIGGLVTLLLGKSPGGTPYSSFRTLDSVVTALAAHRDGRPGLSERTLWSKLVEARRHLDGSR